MKWRHRRPLTPHPGGHPSPRRMGAAARALGWPLIRGVHRRLLAFLLLAMGLGAISGAALQATFATLDPAAPLASLLDQPGPLLLGLFAAFLCWPLAWMATFRIARPMRELATIAHRIGAGGLAARTELPHDGSEVGAVSEALDGLATRLEKQLADQRALLAAVSHELRSPLGRVRLLVELGREGRGPTDLHDQLQAEVDGMDQLVGDLLASARIDFSATNPVNVEVYPLTLRIAQTHGLGPDDLPIHGWVDHLHADPTLLERALSMMLTNAARHAGGPTQLHLHGDATQVRWEVHDQGPGFGPHGPEKAFQPFFRGTDGTGIGLGLSLVRRIAELHHGTAWAEDLPDGGAKVCLQLPVEEAEQ
jgi:two-component system OmpR family sensor kinase